MIVQPPSAVAHSAVRTAGQRFVATWPDVRVRAPTSADTLLAIGESDHPGVEMSRDVEEMGPIDYLVIEFPGSRMSGEGLPLLVDLVDRGTIRILDLVFIRKMPDGAVVRLDLTRGGAEGRPDLSLFEGASSGLLDQGDVGAAAEALQPGSTGCLLVYENRWAAPLATALRRGGAQLVAGGRIPVQAILASLEAAEAAPQRT
jgi:hypothetical protein